MEHAEEMEPLLTRGRGAYLHASEHVRRSGGATSTEQEGPDTGNLFPSERSRMRRQRAAGRTDPARRWLNALRKDCCRSWRASSARSFVRCASLCRPLKPLPYVLVLAISQTVVVSWCGELPGAFYYALGKQDASRLRDAFLQGAALWSAASVLSAATDYITYALSAHFRLVLATAVHGQFFTSAAYARVTGAPGMDNADQRMSADIFSFGDRLASVFVTGVNAPLMCSYYTVAVWRVVRGWTGVACVAMVYLIFGVGLFCEARVGGALSSAMYAMERKEGDLRERLLRVVKHGRSIACYGADDIELRTIEGAQRRVVEEQRRVASRRFRVSLVTNLFSYLGSGLCYLVVAIPVFRGRFSDGDAAEISKRISNAAFVTMQLLYSFSLIIQTSQRVAEGAGLGRRIMETADAAVDTLSAGSHASPSPPQGERNRNASAATTSACARHDAFAKFTRRCPGRLYGPARCSPLGEISVHEVDGIEDDDIWENVVRMTTTSYDIEGGERPPDTNMPRDEAFDASALPSTEVLSSPSGPRTPAPPQSTTRARRIIMTMQRACVDISSASEAAVEEMDRLLDEFVFFSRHVIGAIESRGFWCDAIDPRTGHLMYTKTTAASESPLSTTRATLEAASTSGRPHAEGNEALSGTRRRRSASSSMVFNEIAVASALLGYEVMNGNNPSKSSRAHDHALPSSLGDMETGAASAFPLLRHPEFGTRVYPASIVTDAPIEDVLEAIAHASALHAHGERSTGCGSPTGAERALLEIENLSFRCVGGGRLVARDLSVAVHGAFDSLRGPCSLLIVGHSGVGKSSLLQCICGLLEPVAGTIHRAETVMVVPQQPALCDGSVRANIWYPLPEATPWERHGPGGSVGFGDRSSGRGAPTGGDRRSERFRQAEYEKVMHQLGIAHLEARGPVPGAPLAKGPTNLRDSLSAGEQQLIVMARVLFHRPALVILDEISSSVDQRSTERFYSLMQERRMSYVSISHDRTKVGSFHSRVLEINGAEAVSDAPDDDDDDDDDGDARRRVGGTGVGRSWRLL